MLAYAVDSDEMNDHAHGAKEMTVYHYMSPRKMLHADLRATHEKLDRMVNAVAAGNRSVLPSIVQMLRDLIDMHFKVLRHRQTEVKHLSRRNRKAVRSFWGHAYKAGPNSVYDDIPPPGVGV